MKECTWENCKEIGVLPKVKDDIEWAFLCAKHNLQLEYAVAKKDTEKLMESYISAQGGIERLKESMRES